MNADLQLIAGVGAADGGPFCHCPNRYGINRHMILSNKLQILLCAINDPADRNTSKRRADLQA